MVNCLYELDQVEARHEAFAAGADLAVSRAVPAGSSNPRPRAGKTMAEETDNA